MATRNLPPKDCFVGQSVEGWLLTEEIGRGKIGVVYKGVQHIAVDADHFAAVKIIPNDNLYGPWQTEIKKTLKLTGVPDVVQYKGHHATILNGQLFGCIFWEYVQ